MFKCNENHIRSSDGKLVGAKKLLCYVNNVFYKNHLRMREFKVAFFVLVIGISAAFANPTTGIRTLKVMVIDTGIGSHDKLKPYVQYNGSSDYKDGRGHGTHVAGIVAYGNSEMNDPLCPHVKIYSCQYYGLGISDNLVESVKCVERATKLKMDYINFSGGGSEFSKKEYDAYSSFVNSGGIAVVAAGNERSDLLVHPYYPASFIFGLSHDNQRYPALANIYPVQNLCPDQKICPSSNYYPWLYKEVGQDVLSTLPDNQVGYLSGTSMAAPAFLHNVIQYRCKKMMEGTWK